MQSQRGTTQTLADQDESTDQEEPISFGYKTNMLGCSRNRFWKGHTRGSNQKVHSVHKGKGSSYDRKGRAVPYALPIKECQNEERGDPGDDPGKETLLGNTIRRLYPTADYYAKMGGLSKYFDGYDNQPICWIDDPVSPAVCRTGDKDPVQRFKTVISTGEVLVEVKHGSMVLDSSLIIVTSNMDPRDMAARK